MSISKWEGQEAVRETRPPPRSDGTGWLFQGNENVLELLL